MPQQQLFNPEATSRQELMASRSPQFIALEIRAIKGQLATPPLNSEERQIMKEYMDLTRRFRLEPDPDSPF
jgi:hypothetical protein